MSRAIIKLGQERAASRGMLGLDLRDIATQAEAIIAAARSEADRIVAESRRSAEALREQASREGLMAGREQGLAAGRQEGEQMALLAARARLEMEHASLVESLAKLLTEFRERRESFLIAARRDVVVLAVAIARRITEKLSTMEDITPDIAVEACTEALELVADATQVVIHSHPADARAVAEMAARVSEAMQGGRHIRVVEDEAIGRGGVTIATPDGVIDAEVSQRVERIADELVTGWRQRLGIPR